MRTKKLTLASTIAALYGVLTLLSRLFGLDSGVIQVRFSEALCILPIFTPAAIPGLFVGCLLSNILAGGVIWDVIFGSIATLLGAIGTRFLRKKPYLAVIPPILANAIIVPFVLRNQNGVIIRIREDLSLGNITSSGHFASLLHNIMISSVLESVYFRCAWSRGFIYKTT